MKSISRPRIWDGPLIALAAATLAAHPAAAQDSPNDFQLKPAPTETPQAQGPVTDGVPPPRVARPAPTPTPTPTPLPTIEPPAVSVPTAAPATKSAPRATAPTTAAKPTANVAKPATVTLPPATQPSPAQQPVASASPLATPSISLTATPSPAAASPSPAIAGASTAKSGGVGWWAWLGGLVLIGLGAAGGYVFAQRRRPAEGVLSVPEIERPKVPVGAAPPRADAPAPPPPVPISPDEGLSLALEARQLSLTLTSAALAYRVTLTNNGTIPLTGVTVAGDMISAHASLTEDEQLATASSELQPVHEIASLGAGETTQVTGEFRLPFTSIRAIRKGKAALFVPLARLRVDAAEGGGGAVLLTALVGQRSREPGAGLQPFRLDFGPRIYREVTQRIF